MGFSKTNIKQNTYPCVAILCMEKEKGFDESS